MSVPETHELGGPDGPPDAAPADEGRPRGAVFPVVGVGASAGGLEAVRALVAHLPRDLDLALVVVQHLDPHHESHLVQLLNLDSRLPVRQAEDGEPLAAGRVYVIPPNTSLTVAGGVLRITPRPEGRGPHLPIDHFFRSLADDRQDGAIGVVLSGTGSDGTLGIEEIKAAGGFTFAQDEASARFPSMPQSAVATGCVDMVLTPEGIARELERIVRDPLTVPLLTSRGEAERADEGIFSRVLEILHESAGVDFVGYRQTTIRRRVMRRAVLHNDGDLTGYVARLQRDRAEVQALYHDLLINVTSFFRDPETFEALKQTVFPEVFRGREPEIPFRAWVAGCSTGQEAYSLAIALLEYLDDQPNRPPIQIFATDLSDAVSLRRARQGVYPGNIESQVSPERLRRFFTREDGQYRINKAIRDVCVFAKQNVAVDPPFSHLDLITCRNLLIYLGVPLQRRVIPTFHYALNPQGFLLLGPSETIGPHTDLFAVADSRHRIFARRPLATRLQPPHFVAEPFRVSLGGLRGLPVTAPHPTDWQREADRVLLGQYAPPGVLVDDDFNVLQFRGQTGAYLEQAPGEPSFNLLRMAREGLLPDLRIALDECRRAEKPVRREGARVREDGGIRRVDLKVVPIQPVGSKTRCFLIVFEEPPGAGGPGAAAAGPGGAAPVGFLRRLLTPRGPGGVGARRAPRPDQEADDLRQELTLTREYLQSLVEQHESSDEELRSANEEILSSNEELQSTNEELVTAKEELQSVNEELITVNEQLQQSNRDQSRLNDDLSNLLGSASVPMFVLGIDHCIRRFTPAATTLGLVSGDVGRPIGNIRLAVDVPDLEEIVSEVITSVRPVRREVRGRDGRWYSLQVNPYRTADHRIDGVVVVLFDIDEIKGAGARLREAVEYARAIAETVREPLLVLDPETNVRTANRAFFRTFGVEPAEAEGRGFFEIGGGQWDDPRLRELLTTTLPRERTVENFPLAREFPEVGGKSLLLNARRISLDGDGVALTLLAIEDVSARDQAEQSLRLSEERSRLLLENLTDYAVFFLDLGGKVVGWDEGAVHTLGYTSDEVTGRPHSIFYIPEDIEAGLPDRELRTALVERRASDDNWLVRKDGSRFWASGVTTALRDDKGEARGFVKIVRDLSPAKRAEEALRESELRLRVALSAAQMGTWRWDLPSNHQSLDENLARMCGLRPGEAVRTLDDFLRLMHPEDRAGVGEAFARSVRQGTKLDVEFRVAWPDGTVRWLKDQGDVFYDEDGQPLYMTGACVDITYRKQAEQELSKARDELELRVRERTAELTAANESLQEQFAQRRDLLQRLATAEEDERRRISRELHDEMGQYLTALILELKLVADSVPDDSAARDRLDRLQKMTGTIGQEVHRLAAELRPTALDDVGLPTTLQNYVAEWSARTKVPADMQVTGFVTRAPADAETTIYRIAQEALTNVARHAAASRVSVVLDFKPDHATLIVEDNGRGFDVEATLDAPHVIPHLGLLGMRERVAMTGGDLTIESAPGGPTTLFARIPLTGTGKRGRND